MCLTLGRKFGVPAPPAFFVSNCNHDGEWSNFNRFIKAKSKSRGDREMGRWMMVVSERRRGEGRREMREMSEII